MKILFVFHSAYFFRYFDGVVRELRSRGHDVTLLVGDGVMSKNYTDRSLEACVADTGCRREALLPATSLRARIMSRVRDFAGYSNYFRSDHPSRGWSRQWRTYLDRRVQRLLANPLIHRLVVSRPGRWLLRALDRWTSADPGVAACLARMRPDVLIATPLVFPGSRDAEYVKAARELGIPTVVAVGSWDHLGGKALCTAAPDAVLVWNDEMVWEAIRLHDLPRERVAVVGAPAFDFWFDARPTVGRAQFLASLGLEPDAQYFVYLCSSNPIAGDSEPALVRKISDAMVNHPTLRAMRLLVRPYPSMSHVWKDNPPPGNCRVWPPGGEWPDVPQARQNLFHTLYFSAGTIGLNTTAMLEAAVVGRPCISIVTDEYRRSQGERAHFQQMLRGGFLETPRSPEEAVRVMAAIIAGQDERKQARCSFTERFFRPHGTTKPVAPLYAQAIERSAESTSVGRRGHAATDRPSVSRPLESR